MKRVMPLFALAAMALMMFTGQVIADDESPLVGAWEAISYAGEEIPPGVMWVDNHEDGTGTMHEGEEEFPYTWEHDQDAGTCTIVADGEEMVFDVTFGDDDTCTFTNPDDPNDVMVLRRKRD